MGEHVRTRQVIRGEAIKSTDEDIKSTDEAIIWLGELIDWPGEVFKWLGEPLKSRDEDIKRLGEEGQLLVQHAKYTYFSSHNQFTCYEITTRVCQHSKELVYCSILHHYINFNAVDV